MPRWTEKLAGIAQTFCGELRPGRAGEKVSEASSGALDVELACSREARFDLKVVGESPLAIAEARFRPGNAKSFRQHVQQVLGQVIPGAVLTEASFHEPDHLSRQPTRLEIRGTIPAALLPVGGELYTLPSPTALVGQALGIPSLGYRREDADPKKVPLAWQATPRFQGEPICLQGEISLSMPAGGSVAAQPGLRSIAAPWLAASTAESPVWRVTAEIPRGRFKAGTEEQRLADLNVLATLFRQPFLLHLPDQACQESSHNFFLTESRAVPVDGFVPAGSGDQLPWVQRRTAFVRTQETSRGDCPTSRGVHP